MNRLILAFAALTLVAGDVVQAKAGLIGTTVDTKLYYPNLQTLQQDYGSKVVNPTAFFSTLGGETTTITNTQIIYTSPQSYGSYVADPFNGYTYDFLNVGNLITSVTIDTSSTLSGLSSTDVTLTSDGAGGQLIELNLGQGLSFGPGASVVLDVSTGSIVPEPSSLTMLCIAAVCSVVVVAWRAWTRKSGLSSHRDPIRDRTPRVAGIPG